LFIIGILLGVIANAWINSIFATVEARLRIPYNMQLDIMYSSVSIAFNIAFVIYLTFAGLVFFNISKWRLFLIDVILLVVPIVYTFPYAIL